MDSRSDHQWTSQDEMSRTQREDLYPLKGDSTAFAVQLQNLQGQVALLSSILKRKASSGQFQIDLQSVSLHFDSNLHEYQLQLLLLQAQNQLQYIRNMAGKDMGPIRNIYPKTNATNTTIRDVSTDHKVGFQVPRVLSALDITEDISPSTKQQTEKPEYKAHTASFIQSSRTGFSNVKSEQRKAQARGCTSEVNPKLGKAAFAFFDPVADSLSNTVDISYANGAVAAPNNVSIRNF